MAETDIELAPISPDEPCGPDLDAESDPEFMNFLASIEGQLPDSYFGFDRKTIDFAAAFATVAELRKRTQDLRLILLVAKLAVLNRDFEGFAREVAQIAWLLTHLWEEVHPRAENGRYTARLAQLGTLDDSPVVVLPLQYATLLQTEREIPLNFRAVMVAAGDAKLRDGEKLAAAGAIERISTTVDVEALALTHTRLSRLRQDLDTITAVTAERVDAERAVKFPALVPLVAKMEAFARAALARRDPSLAPAAEESADAPPAGAATFASLREVDTALAAALGYFLANEPSSPALLLIGQARATLGKNLYDVMRLLAPRHADNARVFVGSSDAFSIAVSSLQDAPSADFSPGEAAPAPARGDAFMLMEQVAAHLRSVEPSSPAPYLLDRARALASRDFLSLLADLLPEDDLDSMKKGQ